MSFDLHLESPRLTPDDFVDYFSNRLDYQCDDTHAIYDNPDTGVYFSFDFDDEPPDDEEDGDSQNYPVLFNLNYNRPHFFGLEAEQEVAAFVQHFNCSIHDPQMEGMKDGPYTRGGFLKSWNAGNEFGYRACLRDPSVIEQLQTRPTQELEKVWRWNLQRRERSDALTRDLFIPKITYNLVDGECLSTCAWIDAISARIPRVDALVIPRAALAPRRWFITPTEDLCFVRFYDVLPLFEQYLVTDFEIDAYELPTPSTPPEIRNFVRNLKPFRGERDGVPMDDLLNRELVEKHQTRH